MFWFSLYPRWPVEFSQEVVHTVGVVYTHSTTEMCCTSPEWETHVQAFAVTNHGAETLVCVPAYTQEYVHNQLWQ